MIELIVNENAKVGRDATAAQVVQKMLAEAGEEYRVHLTKKAGDAKRLARELSFADGEKTIWVVGGDGTVNEAVNGLIVKKELTFGFVPAGSGNDYARGLGYPIKTVECIKSLLAAKKEGKYKLHDIGRIELLDGVRLGKEDQELEEKPVEEEIYTSGVTAGIGLDESFVARTDPGVTLKYAGSCGMGYDARVCWEVNRSKLKKTLNKLGIGKLVYYIIAVKQVFSNPRTNMTIVVDGVSRTYTDVIFSCFMMTPYEGGGLMMAPKADPTDGKVSVCLAYGLKPLKVLTVLPLLMKGKHVKKKGVDSFSCKTIEVFAEQPQYIHTDGEVEYQSKHFVVSCDENQVSMYDVQKDN